MALVVSGREAVTSDVASTSWEQFGSYLLFLFSGLFPEMSKSENATEYVNNCNDYMERHFPKSSPRVYFSPEFESLEWKTLLQVKDCLLFAIEHYASALNFSEAEKSSEIEHLKEQQRVLNKQLRPVYVKINKVVSITITSCLFYHKFNIRQESDSDHRNRLLESFDFTEGYIPICESLNSFDLKKDCVDIMERVNKVCSKECHGGYLMPPYYAKIIGGFSSMLRSLRPPVCEFNAEPQPSNSEDSPPINQGNDGPQDVKSPPDNKGFDDKPQDTRQDVKSPPDNKGKDGSSKTVREKLWGIGKWFKSCKCLRS